MDGWMDGWMQMCLHICIYACLCVGTYLGKYVDRHVCILAAYLTLSNHLVSLNNIEHLHQSSCIENSSRSKRGSCKNRSSISSRSRSHCGDPQRYRTTREPGCAVVCLSAPVSARSHPHLYNFGNNPPKTWERTREEGQTLDSLCVIILFCNTNAKIEHIQ